jgi:Flp pilus assembly protein TadG
MEAIRGKIMRHTTRRSQHGAVAVTVALVLLFLLGFIGIALDFGRMFIIKSELQTAMDACALSAAAELDHTATAVTRARVAGVIVSDLNGVDFQSTTWAGDGKIQASKVVFREDNYTNITEDGTKAVYAECSHTHGGVTYWLLPLLNAFSGNNNIPTVGAVSATATARRGPAQTACTIPVAMRAIDPNDSDFGFIRGKWYDLMTEQSSDTGGWIGWMSLRVDERGVPAMRRQLRGECGIVDKQQLAPSDSGDRTSLARLWNNRFGIYQGPPDFDNLNEDMRDDYPDKTGKVYTPTTWPGTPTGSPPHDAYNDYATQQTLHTPCGTDSNDCKSKGPFGWPGNARILQSDDLATLGRNKRVVPIPVIDGSNQVDNFACILLLQPISVANGNTILDNTKIEFLGRASDPSSPCSSMGLPGGSKGALVPVLVR